MNSETILEIREADGYDVVTDQQTICLRMDTSSDCCESPGYFMSEDDLTQFIGAKLLGIAVVDEGLNVHVLSQVPDTEAGGVMFVNLDTSKGLLQFVAYNVHNGYYGHAASVKSTQVTHEEYL